MFLFLIETVENRGIQMKKLKVLVNCSNHPSERWSKEQRENWDCIIDVPFPDVPAYLDTNDRKYQEILIDTKCKIIKAFKNALVPEKTDFQKYLMLQGEFSLCYKLFQLKHIDFDGVIFVVPTTERVVEEVTKPDGTTEKRTLFKFVRWRIV